MRLLLWGLAAAALLATEPGKRLQRKAADKFKELKGKTCGGEAQECDEQTKGEKAESVDVGANGKPTKKEEKKDGKNSDSDQGKRKLRAVSNDETATNESDEDLEESRTAIKDSNERHPEMGSEENEDEAEEPRLEKDTEDEKSEEAEDEEADDEAADEKAEDEKSGNEEEHGIDQKKAAELIEKLNAKPSAPEDELKSA